MKRVVRAGIGAGVWKEGVFLVEEGWRNVRRGTPIEAVPRIFFFPEVEVHSRIPSWGKMCSRCATWAGGRTRKVWDADISARLGLDASPEWRSSRSSSGSESSKVEKTMLARCLFRLVICTERTAA